MSLHVDISKRLGDFSLHAFFTAQDGVLGLLGASGCGKSLTLKCIAGIETPDRGRIVLDGRVLFDSEQKINLPPQRRRVGYLFQNYALFPNMTVRENILCGLHALPDRRERLDKAKQAIALLQLEGCEELRPHQLSGGQAQRTALARILVSRPQLLLLDEPFSALDSHLRLQLQLRLDQLLHRFGHTAILVTHSRDEAYRLCADIAVMENGTLFPPRAARDLFADPQSICAARLTGCKNIAAARVSGEYEVEVPAWGVHLRTAQPVRPQLKAVGIRAHYFDPSVDCNRFPVRCCERVEEPFAWIVQFFCEGQAADSAPLWWRLPKDRLGEGMPEQLGVRPQDVLLLYR